MKKIGHRVGVRRITHPAVAAANNVRTGRPPARLANFISLSGQALNFGASIIALARPPRALAALVTSSSSSSSTFCAAFSSSAVRLRTSRDDPQYRDASLCRSLRQFDRFHFGSRATTIVSLPPCPRATSPPRGGRHGEISHGKKKIALRGSGQRAAIKVNPLAASRTDFGSL